MKHRDSQRGNVFFLILIAIVLLGAFTFSVTRSTSGTNDATREQDKIAATRIIAYGNTLKGAVDMLRHQGVSESDISFANNVVAGYGTVGANPAAELFHMNGGSIAYEKPDAGWLDGVSTAQTGYGEWIFTGHNALRNVGTPINDGTDACNARDCKELLAILPYIKKSVCERINSLIGFPSPIPKDSASSYFNKYTGSFGTDITHIATGTSGPSWGKQQGCMEGGGGAQGPAAGTYMYFQTLIAR